MQRLGGEVLRRGRRRAVGFFGLLPLLMSGNAVAEPPLLGYADVVFLVKSGLLKHDPARVRAVLGDEGARVAAERVALDHVYVATTQAMECALERASARRSNIVQLFTEDVFLANQGIAVLFDAESLATSDRSFAFHSAFPVRPGCATGRRRT